ncbi:MAG: hypothetical protein DME18_00195 [Verrucomicrobia bacterium]|nr:MAG: hypothetical protein DME18_00195 [Verrucomicrobiota bacterium]
MRVVHLLRKYNPAEWGGTETAIQRLFEGLRQHRVTSVAYCPRIENSHTTDPLTESGFEVKRFRACVPIWGIPTEHKRQLIAVGGNLMSFDLIARLAREPNVAVMHTHTLGRLGGVALTAARLRRIPFVVTIHGGVLDLPEPLKQSLRNAHTGGLEWGKLFGALVGSRRLLDSAEAVITCNRREAALLKEKHPGKRIVVQPHGVPTSLYRKDHRETAREAFPSIQGKRLVLAVGRIDPVKNQAWLIEQSTELFGRHPDAILVLAGACTHAAYGEALKREIDRLGLHSRVLLTGGLPPGDARLIGLFQSAEVTVLPSVSETFGLVILEAWAAGTTVISSRTSGALDLIRHGENGWLFDLGAPQTLHQAVDWALRQPELKSRLAAAGGKVASEEYDTTVLAGRMKNLYEQLIAEKNALRNSAR